MLLHTKYKIRFCSRTRQENKRRRCSFDRGQVHQSFPALLGASMTLTILLC